MGVDFDGVGGIGIEFTDEIRQKFIDSDKYPECTEELWEDDEDEFLNYARFPYQTAGSSYVPEIYYYFMVPGKNLYEINSNAPDFIKKLKEVGINITQKDLIVIEDYHIL